MLDKLGEIEVPWENIAYIFEDVKRNELLNFKDSYMKTKKISSDEGTQNDDDPNDFYNPIENSLENNNVIKSVFNPINAYRLMIILLITIIILSVFNPFTSPLLLVLP